MQNYHRYRPPKAVKITNKKIYLQGKNHYRKLTRKQKVSSVLLRRSRRYICRLLPPARANGTKRETVWYSELYLPFSVGMRTIQKDKGSRKKTKYFVGRGGATANTVNGKSGLRKAKFAATK